MQPKRYSESPCAECERDDCGVPVVVSPHGLRGMWSRALSRRDAPDDYHPIAITPSIPPDAAKGYIGVGVSALWMIPEAMI
jgi:hypothetical protein